ncbi:hypothetical protein BLNAU_6851 [Blattamonas nauphoetae]|uniref:Uncharacterized protein n=1 Tax=Blattamonas nauphoetae TaxID=2049346 RepID=A0ABQ9Y328_9EUKA|nr:hypothetical protein BLNAU_6851 [Blattamonas nauphoetae]
MAVVFRSLVATVKLQPSLDDSLEAEAVEFLESVTPTQYSEADAFISSLKSISDEYTTDFVQSIMVLISSASQAIIVASIKMLDSLIIHSSIADQLVLIQADLIPQVIITLNPLSLPFAETEDIHLNLMTIITNSVWFTTPFGLGELKIEDRNKQLAVHKTVLNQVLVPSAKYICHLYLNRYSIVDRMPSMRYLQLLTILIEISPYYQPTMDLIVALPIFLAIPSCLTSFKDGYSNWSFLSVMIDVQQEWNETRGEMREMGKTVDRMLRMEGIEDVMEEKLQNDQKGYIGRRTVDRSIYWNNLQGMNLSRRE